MNAEAGDGLHEGHYAPPETLPGALQRGHGIAAAWLRDKPQHGQLVYECASSDTRWNDRFDERSIYLARLFRHLRLDVTPLVAQLRACGPYRAFQPDPTNDGNRFGLAVGVLAALARTGQEQPREALRDYVHDGIRWMDALPALADRWPVEWWDDLWETAAARIDAADQVELWPDEQPWQRWRGRDSRLDAALTRARRTGARRIELGTDSAALLLDILQAVRTSPGALNVGLGTIRHAGRPTSQLHELINRLEPPRLTGLFGVLRDAPHLLARPGDEQDIPALLTALDRLTDDWCGNDALTETLAQILARVSSAAHADTTARLVRQLRWLATASPHSYERASYLRSLLLLDPQPTLALLPVHLLDCQAQVRLLATQHTALTGDARRWLIELRDDPIEKQEIRNAAAERLDAR